MLNALYRRAEALGVTCVYDAPVTALQIEDGFFVSATVKLAGREQAVRGKALVAAAGGFEANIEWLKQYWGAAADNFLIRGTPFNRGDVLRMLDGTTVEVLNTDAEGRLVLADGLVAASREHPDVIVDVATLTGAVLVALGTRHTGVMGEDQAVADYLAVAGEAGEPAWQLPLPAHMVEELDSPIADLQNAKIGDPAGGSLFAGLFLRHFVGRTGDEADAPRIPWVHLDIAGSAEHKGSPYGFTEKGPTGAAVRSLIAFARASVKEA